MIWLPLDGTTSVLLGARMLGRVTMIDAVPALFHYTAGRLRNGILYVSVVLSLVLRSIIAYSALSPEYIKNFHKSWISHGPPYPRQQFKLR